MDKPSFSRADALGNPAAEVGHSSSPRRSGFAPAGDQPSGSSTGKKRRRSRGKKNRGDVAVSQQNPPRSGFAPAGNSAPRSGFASRSSAPQKGGYGGLRGDQPSRGGFSGRPGSSAPRSGKPVGSAIPLVQNAPDANPKKFETGAVYGNPFPIDPSVTLRVIPLGGVSDTTKNLVVYECGEDIFLLDSGIAFPTEDMPGVDKLIPDISYLADKKDRVRALVVSHGHMDHFGSIPWIVPKIRPDLPIYAPELAGEMILALCEEFDFKPAVQRYDHKTLLRLGRNFALEFYRVAHNVPDSHGIVVHTPAGTIVQTGDWKFDHSPPGNDPATDAAKIAEIGALGVLGVLADSTNAHNPGYQKSESEIMGELEKIFQQKPESRLVATLFSSHLGRILQLITLAEKYGRRVAIDGMSMKKNVEIARRLGYIDVPESVFIDRKDFMRLKPENALAILPGAGGQEESAMARVGRGEHQFIRVEPGDVAIFTSSVVPGTARMVERLVDDFYRQGCDVIDYKEMDIHAGGHAKQEEIKMFYRLLQPRFVTPLYGNYWQRVVNGRIAAKVGIPSDHIFIIDEGNVLEYRAGTEARISPERIETRVVAVDGNRLGEIGPEVIRDRQLLASGGAFFVILRTNEAGDLLGEPEIVTRGFVYLRESRELMRSAVLETAKLYDQARRAFREDGREQREMIRRSLEKWLLRETDREPLVVVETVRA